MKKFEVHTIRKTFTMKSSEKLAQETEDFINKKVSAGYELEHISFQTTGGGISGYIYSYIVFSI